MARYNTDSPVDFFPVFRMNIIFISLHLVGMYLIAKLALNFCAPNNLSSPGDFYGLKKCKAKLIARVNVLLDFTQN